MQKTANSCTSVVQFLYICGEKQGKGYGKTISKL